jgi:CrcB protein
MIRMMLIAGTGGFFGTIARFLTARYIHGIVLTVFPLGTFLVNIAGCLLIGILHGLSQKGDVMTPEWRLFLTVGFCGGFTTFSTFAQENMSLMKDGSFLYFALYTALSVFLGLFACWFGNFLILKLV